MRLSNRYLCASCKAFPLHPFTSFAETTMLFSEYKQRFYDMLEKISNQIEVDVSVYMQDFMILGSYLVIYLVAFGAGVSILFKGS